MKIVSKYTKYARDHIKVISEDQVVRICVDCDFDEKVINRDLQKYEVDKKY